MKRGTRVIFQLYIFSKKKTFESEKLFRDAKSNQWFSNDFVLQF